ncbi:hypothetical protein LCM08_20650 [Salipiger pacificus]|nr:hypothetical protein [Alloyangia pacifica]
MSFLRTTVTGNIFLPDGSVMPDGANIIFTLRSWDKDADLDAVALPGPIVATVEDGAISVQLIRTASTDLQTTYDVGYIYRNQWTQLPVPGRLGVIAISGAGPVDLADILALPAPVPNVPDALAQAIAAAAGAMVAAQDANNAALMALVGTGTGFDTQKEVGDSTLVYGANAITHNGEAVTLNVEAGDRWVSKEGFTYDVLDAAAPMFDLANAAGVKLWAKPRMSQIAPDQIAECRQGGDDVDAVNKAITAIAREGGGRVMLQSGVYSVSAPVQVQSGVTLEGPGATQFDEGTPATIRAAEDFAGVAVVDLDTVKNVGVEKLRIEGTWRNKQTPGDPTYTSSGEACLRLRLTGGTVLRDLTCRYADAEPLLVDGAWQTWIYGGFWKQSGKPVTITGRSGRAASQFWWFAPNIQQNRWGNLLFEDYVGDGDLSNGDNYGVSQFNIFGGIIEFAFSATDDSKLENYDPNYRAPVWVQKAKDVSFYGTHIANGDNADSHSPVVLVGTERELSDARASNVNFFGGYIQANKGVGVAITKPASASLAQVDTMRLDRVRFPVVGLGSLIDVSNALPKGEVEMGSCSVWRFNGGERGLPVNYRDVKTGGYGAGARAKVRIRNAEGQIGRQASGSTETVPAGDSITVDTFVPGARTDGESRIQAMPNPYTNYYDEADLGGVTVSAGTATKPNWVPVTYTNPTGAAVALPDHYLWIITNNRQDLTTERFDQKDITPGTIVAGGRHDGSISIFGLSLGMFLRTTYTADLQGCDLIANIRDSGNVDYSIINRTGADVTLAAGTIKFHAQLL